MKFITRRLATYAFAAWIAITVNFFIPRFIPGNAAEAMMAKFPSLQPAALKAIEIEFGIGKQGSLFHQYTSYLVNIFHGNLGISTNFYPATVTSVLKQTLPWTLILVGTATVISFVLGTVLGILAAWRRGGKLDQLLPALTFLQAVPYFFLALIAVEIFAVHWHIFPIGQGFSLGFSPGWNWPFIQSAIYHSICLLSLSSSPRWRGGCCR